MLSIYLAAYLCVLLNADQARASYKSGLRGLINGMAH